MFHFVSGDNLWITYAADLLGRSFYLITKLKMADEDLHSTDSSVPLSQVKTFYQIDININA